MRTALILAFAAAFAATSVACAMEQADSGTSLRKPSKKSNSSSKDDDEDDEDVIVDDSVGNTDIPDPTNPNANTSAAPPTGTGTAAPGFALTVDNATPTIDLASTTTMNVTVEPKNGFAGTVNITVEGLPPGVTAAPASGAPGSPIVVKLTSTTSAPVTPTNGKVELTIKGASGDQTATAPANFKVLPKLLMTVPTNAQALIQAGGTHFVEGWGGEAFGEQAIPLKTQADNPIVVTVRNDDSTARTIHGDNGFKHGTASVAPGAIENLVRSFKPGANASGYLHGVKTAQSQNAGVAVAFHLKVVATD